MEESNWCILFITDEILSNLDDLSIFKPYEKIAACLYIRYRERYLWIYADSKTQGQLLHEEISDIPSFISKSIQKYPSRRLALILDNLNFIRDISMKFDLVCLDMSYSATLELLLEVESKARFCLCFQNERKGSIIHPNILDIFELEPSSRNLGLILCSIDPENTVLIDLHDIKQLYDSIKSYPLKRPITMDYCVIPHYWQLQDLYSIILCSEMNSVEIAQFQKLFRKCVIYQRSLKLHGLNCLLDIEMEHVMNPEIFHDSRYNLTFGGGFPLEAIVHVYIDVN